MRLLKHFAERVFEEQLLVVRCYRISFLGIIDGCSIHIMHFGFSAFRLGCHIVVAGLIAS